MNRYRRPLALLLAVPLGVLVVTVFVWPQAVNAQFLPVISQLISFRVPLAIVLGITAVLAAGVAFSRRTWGVAAVLAIVLGVACAGNGAVLLLRGTGGSLPEGDLTVVVWNTQGGATSPREVARLLIDTHADIVSLPEMDEQAAAEVARRVTAGGLRMNAHTTRGATGDSLIPTSVLIADKLGDYSTDTTAGSTPGLPSAVWRPADGSGPTIVAAHPSPPLPDSMDDWRTGLQWVADQCDEPDTILAGDLNATADHLSALGTGPALIGGCEDAAVQSKTGAIGTWPTTIPAWMAAPIDHVLVGSAWEIAGVRVVTSHSGGTDHRPVVAVLERA